MRAFVRRVVNAIAREPEDERRERERRKQAASQKPPECDLCNLEGHTRDNCWAVIKNLNDIERTWARSGRPEQSSGTGPTFDEMREFWKRMQEGRQW